MTNKFLYKVVFNSVVVNRETSTPKYSYRVNCGYVERRENGSGIYEILNNVSCERVAKAHKAKYNPFLLLDHEIQ